MREWGTEAEGGMTHVNLDAQSVEFDGGAARAGVVKDQPRCAWHCDPAVRRTCARAEQGKFVHDNIANPNCR